MKYDQKVYLVEIRVICGWRSARSDSDSPNSDQRRWLSAFVLIFVSRYTLPIYHPVPLVIHKAQLTFHSLVGSNRSNELQSTLSFVESCEVILKLADVDEDS